MTEPRRADALRRDLDQALKECITALDQDTALLLYREAKETWQELCEEIRELTLSKRRCVMAVTLKQVVVCLLIGVPGTTTSDNISDATTVLAVVNNGDGTATVFYV